MAIGQVIAAIMAVRATRRMSETLGRFEENVRPIIEGVRPIVANVQQLSEDAARATAIATAQVERAERMMDRAEQMVDDVSRKVDETTTMVQRAILAPARNGIAIIEGVKAALGAFFGGNSSRRRSPGPSTIAEEDASFIG